MLEGGSRLDSKMSIVYGRNPVREALRGPRNVRRVWVHGRVQDEDWLKEAASSGVDVRSDSLTKIETCAGSDAHQGVVAEVDPYNYFSAETLLDGPDSIVVALDQVQDPQNLGAIARVAECAGVSGLIVPERRSASVTPAVCSASSGAVEHLKIARVVNMANFLIGAKKRECWVHGAASEGDVTYTDVDLTGPLVLVFGSEGKGLRPRVAASCDSLISIPIAGAIGSLNVSATAAILLFEAARQRM